MGFCMDNLEAFLDESYKRKVIKTDEIIYFLVLLYILVIGMRVLFCVSVRSAHQYHFAVQDHYDFEDFSDTSSEHSSKKLVKRRKRHWDQLRRDEDLTTVKESIAEYNMSYKPMSVMQTEGMHEIYGRGRSPTKQMADLLMPMNDMSVLSEGDAADVNAAKTQRDHDDGTRD